MYVLPRRDVWRWTGSRKRVRADPGKIGVHMLHRGHVEVAFWRPPSAEIAEVLRAKSTRWCSPAMIAGLIGGEHVPTCGAAHREGAGPLSVAVVPFDTAHPARDLRAVSGVHLAWASTGKVVSILWIPPRNPTLALVLGVCVSGGGRGTRPSV